MDIRNLVEYMIQQGNFQQVVGNPLAQFGIQPRTYLGPTLLPEKTVPEIRYVEEGIRYRTVIANSGTRYSPVQIKGGVMVGAFEVALGDSDIGSHFTGAEYDALIRLIDQMGDVGGTGADPSPQALMNLTQWADRTLNLPLVEYNELQRWQAICDAQVVRVGDNGYYELVDYPNPPGHRVTAGGTWSNNGYDPYADIIAGAEALRGIGYTVNRMITSTPVFSKLANNTLVKTRVGRVSIISGTVVGLPGRATRDELNNLFQSDGLPAFETYDLQYRTQTGSDYFYPRDGFTLIATTGRDQSIDLGDMEPIVVQDTLGYTAVGRATGQSSPGRVMKTRAIDDSKPPRIEGEAWQTSLPVIVEPMAIYHISGIS